MSRSPKTLIEFFPDRIGEIKPDITAEEEAALTQALREKKDGLSYYSMLGLDSAATPGEIRKAYKTRAVLCHPDKCPGPNGEVFFKQLGAAYETLLDAKGRRAYDDVAEIFSPSRSSQQQQQATQAQASMTDEARSVELLCSFLIPKGDCVAYVNTKPIPYQKLSEALKTYWNPDPALYVFIVLKTTDEGIRKDFIEDIKVKARKEIESTEKTSVKKNKIAEQFDQGALSVRSDIERSVCDVKIQYHRESVRSPGMPLQYEVTQKFLSDFSNLIKDGEEYLRVQTKEFSSGKRNLDQYGHGVATWLKSLSEKIKAFCGELLKEEIQIKVNELSSPTDQLKSMIAFFQTTEPFKSYDVIDPKVNLLFEERQAEAISDKKDVPMSTLVMQADYLSTIARNLGKRLGILETPKPGCYRDSQPYSPTKVTRVLSPTAANQQFNPLNDLDNKIEQIALLNEQNNKICVKLDTLSDWKAAFRVSSIETQKIENERNENNRIICANLGDIARQSGSNVTALDLGENKKFIMLKAAVLTSINSYLEKNKNNSGKADGVSRARDLQTKISTITDKKIFFNVFAEHLARVEGSGFFKHPGRLNEDSLDTAILNTIKSNDTAFAALKDEVKGIQESDNNVTLRDKIVAQCKQPSSAAAASAAASSLKR